MNSIAFIGIGRVGQTLAQAFSNASWPVAVLAGRNIEPANQLARSLPRCRAASMEDAARCDLVFLTVPDDVIAEVAARLSWRTGQMVVHCSGSAEINVLDSAAAQGALVGCFHPLQIFSNPEVALSQLRGSSVAIEGPDRLSTELRGIASSLGLKVLRIPPGGRALYHAGASYAASLMLPLLHEAVQLWQHLGISEEQTLSALLPLVRGTFNAVEANGLAQALSGPVSRDDMQVVRRHLEALAAQGPSHVPLYSELTRRQLPLALTSKRLNPAQAHQWSSQLHRWEEDSHTGKSGNDQ